MELTTIIFFITTALALAWALFVRSESLDTINLGNEKLNAIVRASRREAIASDFYIRSMADGTLTIEEGEKFKNYAAEAIISHLTLVEEITGKQIYNRPEVPLPLPVGGKRVSDLPEGCVSDNKPVPIPEQPAQPVSTEPVGA